MRSSILSSKLCETRRFLLHSTDALLPVLYRVEEGLGDASLRILSLLRGRVADGADDLREWKYQLGLKRKLETTRKEVVIHEILGLEFLAAFACATAI